MKKLMLITGLLSVLAITNAQIDDNIILDTDMVQRNEVKITPEITERAVFPIKNISERDYSRYSIKNKSQLENLQLGKPIPYYIIKNETLTFADNWSVPVMCDGEPLFFELGVFDDGEYFFIDIGNANINIIESIHNYEHKDSIIGSLGVTRLGRGMDYLMIRKENKVLFIQVYDEATDEYLKNEYSLSEIINLEKERTKTEAQNRAQNRDRYLEYVANKSELIIPPELEERVFNRFRNASEKFYPTLGIKNKEQLTNLELGKPMPLYRLHYDSLQFTGSWEVLVMSDGVPFFAAQIKLQEDGQYKYMGGGAVWTDVLRSYEHKDLIIGHLGISEEMRYLIIRKNGKDIFVKTYDRETREYLKKEYSLSEIINLLKK